MFIKFAKIVLSCDPKKLAVGYVVLIAILSSFFACVRIPATFLSDSKNLLNAGLFKPSLNYTVGALLIFVVVVHLSLHRGRVKPTLVPVGRVIFAPVLYSLTKLLIDVVGELVGECVDHAELNNRQLLCTSAGYAWRKFSTSGHTNYLLYEMLLIVEETAVFKRWLYSDYRAFEVHEHSFRIVDADVRTEKLVEYTDAEANDGWYTKWSPWIRTLYVAFAVWMLMLHFSMLVTIVYFHAILQKVGGAVVAASLWCLTYGLIYKLLPDTAAQASFARISQLMYQSVDEGVVRT